jgi:glucose-6-phosphate 1-dehydrogenase
MDQCTLVIFGATGNLTRIKLMPALFSLEVEGRLPEKMTIVAFARREWNNERWCDEVATMLAEKYPQGYDPAAFERFRARLHYAQGSFDDAQAYVRLGEKLANNGLFSPNVIFYMAIPPADFGPAIEHLSAVGLLIDEKQVFRIDHYLGKETVQNLLVFRFANTCSSRTCGTATTSTTCRSPWPRRSASASGPITTTRPARCATCCRTT